MKCTCGQAVREATAPLLAEIERLRLYTQPPSRMDVARRIVGHEMHGDREIEVVEYDGPAHPVEPFLEITQSGPDLFHATAAFLPGLFVSGETREELFEAASYVAVALRAIEPGLNEEVPEDRGGISDRDEAIKSLQAEIERLTADRDDQNRVLRQMVTVGNIRSTEIDSLKAQVEIEREAADRLNDLWNEQKAEIERLTRTPSVDLSEHAVMAMELLDAQGIIAELRDHLSMAEDVNRALRATLDGRKASAGHNGASEQERPPAARSEALRDEPTFPRGDLIA